MLNFILGAIAGTPWWVWVVFVYLLFIGIKSMKRRNVYLPKLFIIPIVLTAIKYKVFFLGGLNIWTAYFVSLIIGLGVGYRIAIHEKIRILKQSTSIELSGSYHTFIILMLFFSIKYVFGYLYDVNSALSAEYLNIEIAISGLFSGYFLGKSLNYLRRFIVSA